jgi:hypothetical protein
MEILALGMSRTGTESIKSALERLGYGPVYHSCALNPKKDRPLWEALIARKFPADKPTATSSPLTEDLTITREDFDQILGHVRAVTEMPCAAFWAELMTAYPDAKILLVERDIDQWYRSFVRTTLCLIFAWRKDVFAAAARVGLLPSSLAGMYSALFQGYFRAPTKFEMLTNLRAVYVEHNAAILKRAESEGRQILRMDISEGWAPLCRFLKKDVPEGVPFPVENTGDQTLALCNQMRAMTMTKLMGRIGRIGLILGSVCVSSWYGWFLWRS